MQIRMEALLFDLVVLVGKPVLSFVMTCIILAKRQAVARDSGRPKRAHRSPAGLAAGALPPLSCSRESQPRLVHSAHRVGAHCKAEPPASARPRRSVIIVVNLRPVRGALVSKESAQSEDREGAQHDTD